MTDKDLDKIYEDNKGIGMGDKAEYLKLSEKVRRILEEEGKFDRPEFTQENQEENHSSRH